MRRMLKTDPEVKAIVSSGYSTDTIMADFKRFGFAGVVAKPYRLDELGEVLYKVITGNRSRGDRDSYPDRRDIPVPPNESAGLEPPAYRGFRAP
jgi:hypothetical protein